MHCQCASAGRALPLLLQCAPHTVCTNTLPPARRPQSGALPSGAHCCSSASQEAAQPRAATCAAKGRLAKRRAAGSQMVGRANKQVAPRLLCTTSSSGAPLALSAEWRPLLPAGSLWWAPIEQSICMHMSARRLCSWDLSQPLARPQLALSSKGAPQLALQRASASLADPKAPPNGPPPVLRPNWRRQARQARSSARSTPKAAKLKSRSQAPLPANRAGKKELKGLQKAAYLSPVVLCLPAAPPMLPKLSRLAKLGQSLPSLPVSAAGRLCHAGLSLIQLFVAKVSPSGVERSRSCLCGVEAAI